MRVYNVCLTHLTKEHEDNNNSQQSMANGEGKRQPNIQHNICK